MMYVGISVPPFSAVSLRNTVPWWSGLCFHYFFPLGSFSIVLQVQHLTDLDVSSHNEGGSAENNQSRASADEPFAISSPALIKRNHHHSITTPSFVLPDLVHTLIHRLLTAARQRVCIFSATDAAIGDLREANGAPLKILFSLLLLHLTTADGNNDGKISFFFRSLILI